MIGKKNRKEKEKEKESTLQNAEHVVRGCQQVFINPRPFLVLLLYYQILCSYLFLYIKIEH